MAASFARSACVALVVIGCGNTPPKDTGACGRQPTVEEVAEELGIPRNNWPLLKRTIIVSGMGPSVSLDVLSQNQDTVEDANTKTPDEELSTNDLLQKLSELLDNIDEREATILRLRYGLGNGAEPMTLKEIGKVIGLTRERVRQIEQDALRKLYGVMSGEGQDFSGRGSKTTTRRTG